MRYRKRTDSEDRKSQCRIFLLLHSVLNKAQAVLSLRYHDWNSFTLSKRHVGATQTRKSHIVVEQPRRGAKWNAGSEWTAWVALLNRFSKFHHWILYLTGSWFLLSGRRGEMAFIQHSVRNNYLRMEDWPMSHILHVYVSLYNKTDLMTNRFDLNL